jgi:hypothetical protein
MFSAPLLFVAQKEALLSHSAVHFMVNYFMIKQTLYT